jgi:hypothetical protein
MHNNMYKTATKRNESMQNNSCIRESMRNIPVVNRRSMHNTAKLSLHQKKNKTKFMHFFKTYIFFKTRF